MAKQASNLSASSRQHTQTSKKPTETRVPWGAPGKNYLKQGRTIKDNRRQVETTRDKEDATARQQRTRTDTQGQARTSRDANRHQETAID